MRTTRRAIRSRIRIIRSIIIIIKSKGRILRVEKE